MSSQRYRNSLISVILRIGLILLLIIRPSPLAANQSPKLLFTEALQASKDGDLINALGRWDQFLEYFPEDAIALSNRGIVRLALGDSEGAISDQTKSIEILPDEVDSHLNRGIAEESLNLLTAAERDYKWILEHDPENASALYNLGNVMLYQENWMQAEALFDRASLVRTDFSIARSSKALTLYQLGELEKAELELRKIIRRYPMLADARAALTALLWRKGSFGEAESHWAAAVGLDSRYRQQDWLLKIRRWPPEPIEDLFAFLTLESR